MNLTRTTSIMILLVATLGIVLALAETWRLSVRHPTISLALASPNTTLVIDGFHEPEQDGPLHFRWSAGQSNIRLLNAGMGGMPVLSLWLAGGPPANPAPDLAISIGDRQLAVLPVAERPRRYLLSIPPSYDADRLTVHLSSATVSVAPDPRALGVRVIGVALDRKGAGVIFPALSVLFAPFLALAAIAVCCWRIGLSVMAAGSTVLAAAAILALAQFVTSPVFMPIYLLRLAGGALVVAALTALLLPALERRLTWVEPRVTRMLWGAALLACAVRLVGTLYPPFDAYDLSLNLGRFFRTIGGALVDTNRSFEFREGVTVYPSGPYLTLMPGLLLGLTPKLAVQGSIALLDGLGAFTTGLLALRLGQSPRVALFTTLAYAALPVMLTSLWFGHTAQVFGQGVMAPLALAMLTALERNHPRDWWIAGALLSMALLSHIGVTILALAWLGLLWLALLPQPDRHVWRRMTVMLAVSTLIGLALVYGPMAQLKLAEIGKVSTSISGGDDPPAYNLIWRAIQISFYELGWLLALPGLFLIRSQRLPRGSVTLLGAWLVASLVFLIVELITGLQVRYLVFLAPIACILIGIVLARLAEYSAMGTRLAWGTLALLLASGATPWYIGIYQNIQMSMIPLLR